MRRPPIDRFRAGLVLLALGLAPLTSLRLYSADEIQYFAHLRSAVFDRDLDFTNEYRWFYERDPEGYAGFARTFLGPLTPAGRPPNNAPIGSAVLWAPLYLAAAGLEAALGGERSEPPGFSRTSFAAVCLASMLYGVLGLLLANEVCRRFASPGAAFAATLLVWLGTNLLFYMYVTPPMSHACSFFAASLFLWWWLRAPLDGRRALVLGLLGGLVASVRWQDVLIAAAPLSAPLLAGEVRSRAAARRWAGHALAIAAGILVAFTPQMLVWIVVNGSLTPYGVITVSGRLSPWAPHLFAIFFSSFHGLFVWSPVLIPAFAGLVLLAVRDGRGRGLAVAVAAQVYLLAGYAAAFGHGFGQRLFIGSLPAAAAGLAVFCDRAASWRALGITAAALAVWWNLSLVVQYGTGMIPRNAPVDLDVLVRNQLVEVPRRLPAIAARYLFARSSFYELDPRREDENLR